MKQLGLDEVIDRLGGALSDFESGYIANPSARADKDREKHERTIREAIRHLKEAKLYRFAVPNGEPANKPVEAK